MLDKFNLHVELVGHVDLELVRIGNALAHGLLRRLADAADSLGRMDGHRTAAAAILRLHGIDIRVEPLGLLAHARVAGDHQQRHIVHRADERIDDHLAGLNAVDLDGAVLRIHGMGQRAGIHVGGRVIAGEHCAGKARVDARHHGVDFVAPAAEKLHILRQLRRNEVARAVVRVLDVQIVAAAGSRALAGGGDLSGHLAAEGFIFGFAQFGLIPVADAAGTLDIRGNKNTVKHGMSPLFIEKRADTIRPYLFLLNVGAAICRPHIRLLCYVHPALALAGAL